MLQITQDALPLLDGLSQPCVRPRHWTTLTRGLGLKWPLDDSTGVPLIPVQTESRSRGEALQSSPRDAGRSMQRIPSLAAGVLSSAGETRPLVVGDLLDAGLLKRGDIAVEVASSAEKEDAVERKLGEMQRKWQQE